MNTYPTELNTVLGLCLGGDTFQEFIDRYKEKYNTLEIDGFEFEPLRINHTWQQLIAETGAATLPAYVDPESEGYEQALSDINLRTGNIPTMKKYYRLNRVIVQEQMQLLQKIGSAAITPQMRDVFMRLMDEGTDGLLQSFYNALTHQRHQIVSTGKFEINATNNPRGLRSIELSFGVGNFDTIQTTKRWWTDAQHIKTKEGADADPIGYIRDRIKAIRRTYNYYGSLRLEMSKDLAEDLLDHSAVLSRIGFALYPSAGSNASDVAKNATYEARLDMFKRLCGVDNMVLRDSYSYVDSPGTVDGNPDLTTTRVENFKKENIALIPDGKIGGIQGVEPLTLGYSADEVASYDGGRIKFMQRAEKKTHSIYVDAESAQLCVPYAVKQMFISTVTV